MRPTAVIMVLACLGGSGFTWAGFLDTLETEIMTPNGVTWPDLDLRRAMTDTLPFALPEVEALLQSPRASQDLAETWERRLVPSKDEPLGWDSLALALPGWVSENRYDPSPLTLAATLRLYARGLSPEEWAFLRIRVSSLFVLHPDDTLLDAVTMEKQRLLEKENLGVLFALARRLKPSLLLQAGRSASGLEAALRDSLRVLGPRKGMAAAKRLARRAGLPFHAGGPGSDSHRISHGVWVDPGGDDAWEIVGDGKPGRALIVVDMQGRDSYSSRDSLPASPGFGGLVSFTDLAGDDNYQDAGFGFAAGLFGLARIFDAEGRDRYHGHCATQGFGFFGIGLLQDRAGDDEYSAALFAQGAASTGGLGLLFDEAGQDSYAMRPVFLDDLRYRDHFLSMGQGFATGLMLGEAGGIGLLLDLAGHDTYVADIFAQGSGYWHALGMLIDKAGGDRYVAHQYAQGAGVHEAIGLLWDGGGDDTRQSKGVSQGCGHDRGLGLLFDASGEDRYFAVDMSQGAGSANGLGILCDAAGHDAYHAARTDMALGHADMRRDRGSFGFFFDMQGRDSYPHGFRDSSAWRVYGKDKRGNGFGLDR